MARADLVKIVEIVLGESFAVVGNDDRVEDVALFVPEETHLALKSQVDGDLAGTRVDRVGQAFTDDVSRRDTTLVVLGNEFLKVDPRHVPSLVAWLEAGKSSLYARQPPHAKGTPLGPSGPRHGLSRTILLVAQVNPCLVRSDLGRRHVSVRSTVCSQRRPVAQT